MINSLFQKVTGKNKSSQVAKKRLKFALVYDNLDVSDEILELLKNDICQVISKYFEIEKEGITLDIDRADDYSALVFNSPIISALRR